MIVVDASAVIQLLLGKGAAAAIGARMRAAGGSLHAPQLLDLEVAQVLRRYVGSGDMRAERGRAALDDFADLAVHKYAHEPLLRRVWELRNKLTAYDAAYVALAEALDAPLVTRDTRLAGTAGHGARIELI